MGLTWGDGQVTELGDGDQGHFAKNKFGPYHFDYAEGERITGFQLWGNGVGAYCGAMRFKTTKQKDGVTINAEKTKGDGYEVGVDCGILVGFRGLSG